MQASFEMSQGRANLRRIIADFPIASPHWNEAQNRFQFVDRLLIECLGWERPYIEVERFDEAGGRADYLLGKPIRSALEAKKEAKRFDFLPTTKPKSARKLRPLVDACATLKAACLQVIGYCAIHGARLAIVCNGPQLVIFQSGGDGASPLDADCFVFDGFSSYLDNFSHLWRLLSPEGVYENVAARALAELHNPRSPVKAATAIAEPKAHRYRTPFQQNLKILSTILLDDVEENPATRNAFYKECYVAVGLKNDDSLLHANVLASRYNRVSESGSAPANLTARVYNGVVEIDEAAFQPTNGRPLLVVGDVGVGKTFFFKNLFERLDEDEKAQTLYIHINLGDEAALTADVRSYFLKIAPIILKDVYGINIDQNEFVQTLYSPEIVEFDDSVEGQLRQIDEGEFLKARIAYLASLVQDRGSHVIRALNFIVRAYSKQVLIVLDNADQRTSETQQQAFLVAQELASTRALLIFVALRPSTFYASKLRGTLSGYKNEVLSISPPPAHEVIRKRIIFALRIAEGRVSPEALQNVSLNLSSIVSFLWATLRSIRRNPEIRRFLSNITGGNTRLVVELIASFFGSPNVESEKIVRIEEETKGYLVALHEFTKHALLGEYSYYNSTSSLVACNVFDVKAADRREHFLGLLLIAYLNSFSGIRDGDGFVAGVVILTEMMRLSFSEVQVRACMRNLAERRLIETPYAHFREIDVSDDVLAESFPFRATSVGIYHALHWAGSFSFLDAMCIDTPIFEEEQRDIVLKKASGFDIKDRFAKASAFRNYLLNTWFNANFDVNYYDFQAVINGQSATFESVQRHVQRGRK